MKTAAALLVASLLAVAAPDASAQRFPGRDRGESPRREREREQPRAPAAPQEPFAALERELPSLKVDLQLKAEQVAAWSLVERDVRDLAELDRQRRRQLLALRDPADAAPSARDMLGRLAESARRKAEAAADLQRHFDGLYGLLDEPQRRMIDRRFVLSQTEPLGPDAPPRR